MTETTPIADRPGETDRIVSTPMYVTEALSPTTLERCDRCGGDEAGNQSSQAVYKIVMLSGAVLTFCAHHAKRFRFVAKDAENYMHAENKKTGSANS
jgi:hypothetical protein